MNAKEAAIMNWEKRVSQIETERQAKEDARKKAL